MSATSYSNGPLPDFLKDGAYVAADSNEFALTAADAKQYLDWCRRLDQQVIGIEAWRRTESGHEEIDDWAFEGNARACKAAIDECEAEFGEGIVYCVWVEVV